jgi:hypothetical protein
MFKSSVAKSLISMLGMDFKRFIFKIYVYICNYFKYWNVISLKKMSFIKKSYDIFHWPQKVSPPLLPLFLSLSRSLFFSMK